MNYHKSFFFNTKTIHRKLKNTNKKSYKKLQNEYQKIIKQSKKQITVKISDIIKNQIFLLYYNKTNK